MIGCGFLFGPPDVTSEAKGYTMRDDQTSNDIDYILQQATQCGSVPDELALIRISLRAYADGMDAADAVAWAAKELSKSITRA